MSNASDVLPSGLLHTHKGPDDFWQFILHDEQVAGHGCEKTDKTLLNTDKDKITIVRHLRLQNLKISLSSLYDGTITLFITQMGLQPTIPTSES